MTSLKVAGMTGVMDSSAKAMESFEDLLNEYGCVTPKQGTVVLGTLTSHDKTGFRVEIGGKSEAFVPFADAGELTVGAKAGFIVLGAAAPFGRVGEFDETAVRLSHVRYLEVEQLNAMQTKGEVGYAYVTGVNKDGRGIEAGLDVEIHGTAGFIPSREVEKRPENGLGRLWNFIGKTIPVKVLPPDNKRRRANSKTMFSHAAAMLELARQYVEPLNIGDALEGTVVRHSYFKNEDRSNGRLRGVVVKLSDTVNGFVPKAQVSFSHDVEVTELLPIGKKVAVTVFKKNVEEGTLQLSTKQSTIDWERAKSVAVNDVVEGVVEHILEREDITTGTKFQSALLVKLSSGLTAEVRENEVTPRSKVAIGIRCPVGVKVVGKVIGHNKYSGRPQLTLSPMRQPIFERLAASKGLVIEGLVVSEIEYGYFIAFDNGDGRFLVDGLCHKQKLRKSADGSEEKLTVGERVKVKVENVSSVEPRTVSVTRQGIEG